MIHSTVSTTQIYYTNSELIHIYIYILTIKKRTITYNHVKNPTITKKTTDIGNYKGLEERHKRKTWHNKLIDIRLITHCLQ